MRNEKLAQFPHWPWVVWLVYGAFLLAVGVFLPPLTQDLSYHHFVDVRVLWGIPRCGDVLSNLAILLPGVLGLVVMAGQKPKNESVWWVQTVFFGAVALTGLGSAYYHWAPDSQRILWDRLPLALVAACFPVLILVDRIQPKGAAKWATVLWLVFGPLTVLYWYWGDAQGAGDLWPYTLVKLVGILMCLVFWWVLPSRFSLSWVYPVVVVLYILAGVAEAKDAAVYNALGVISGHTLKHLLAGVAVVALAWMVAKRNPGFSAHL